jgi:transcriptional regulator with XRE-family HTH domain
MPRTNPKIASARKRHFVRIGKRVKQARLDAGLSLGQVAQASGYCKTAIWYLERGERTINPHMLNSVATALGLEPSAFLIE